ncbi:hypothetical protein EVAR_55832_1 [Eumeta japonica]|uniref:Uncharacterized protein n=1 Tax=Eumeta variegata TaxID=151549 RepID=A0A4C1YTW1_EUMVA|nr:hypothetical protein EVAR_55832_1 [Eumeta japonica]
MKISDFEDFMFKFVIELLKPHFACRTVGVQWSRAPRVTIRRSPNIRAAHGYTSGRIKFSTKFTISSRDTRLLILRAAEWVYRTRLRGRF